MWQELEAIGWHKNSGVGTSGFEKYQPHGARNIAMQHQQEDYSSDDNQLMKIDMLLRNQENLSRRVE